MPLLPMFNRMAPENKFPYAVLDCVEEHLQEASLARQPLHHGVQALGIEPVDAPEDLVEKAGFRRCHQNHFFFLKYQ